LLDWFLNPISLCLDNLTTLLNLCS
jgi:hypothetical protein